MTESGDIARTRQGLYRFFGGFLLPPRQDHFDLLAGAAEVLGDRDIDTFAFSPTWRRFVRHLPLEVEAARIEVDYVRLFASGMSGALAPPTESYYRVPAKGGGIAEYVAELQHEYSSMNIAIAGLEEAPDHISTELEVMAHLCGSEADAWSEEDLGAVSDALNLQSRFLHQHLTVWVPAFHQRVIAANPPSFYGDLIDAVLGLVIHDKDHVHLVRDWIST